ncbi:MAG: iron transporter [Lachnospiraceae bacterium]|nr:iron transporter [Lachnospiraceae bacterium]
MILKRKIVMITLLLSAAMLGGCGAKSTTAESGQAATTANTGVEDTDTELSSLEGTSEEISESTEISKASEPSEVSETQSEPALPDGTYSAEFKTDSSMFHVSEACDGKGTLTVENGKMTIHVSLGSKKIVNLYPGLAEDAAKDGAELLQPTTDTVTYSDGMTEEVYGFDIPIPALETEFDLALIGTKEKWYDHRVSVSNLVALEAGGTVNLADGSYTVALTFAGGSGKAEILSPATMVVTDGKAVATVQWSSPNYDYMLVDGDKYLPVNTEGNSVFEIPVLAFDEPIDVIGDTVAMSKPHEVEYTLTFHSDTIKE